MEILRNTSDGGDGGKCDNGGDGRDDDTGTVIISSLHSGVTGGSPRLV